MYEDLLNELDQKYVLNKLEDMIKIPSVVGKEGDIAEYLKQELEYLGLETETDIIRPNRPNIYAKLEGKEPGKRIHFNGHTDTVPVVDGWDHDPYNPMIEGNRIYGLGSNDMKGGIACILNTIKAFVESNTEFNGEISFSAVIDEEAFGIGAKAMLKTDYGKVDGIILAEPYMANKKNPTPLGITGKILYDIYVKGKAAHGFHPEAGINAVEQAGIILANLDKLSIPEHPEFKGNYSTLKIEGGYNVYSVVVPASCRFEVNRLIIPGETVETAIRDMETLVKSLNLDAEILVKTKPPYYSPYTMDRSEKLIKNFEWAYQEVNGLMPSFGYSSSITDANTFTGDGGIPCVHLGPYPGGTHQKNEYTLINSLQPVSKVYALLAAKFLKD